MSERRPSITTRWSAPNQEARLVGLLKFGRLAGLRCALALALLVAVLICGCGGSKSVDAPPPAARESVIGLLDALGDGRFGDACRAVSSTVVADLRDAALGAYRVRPGTATARLREVRTTHALAASCVGTMNLVARESRADLRELTRRAHSLPVAWLGPAGSIVTVGVNNEDYDVERHGSRWIVIGVNALAPAP